MEYTELELNKMIAELEGENKSAVEDCLKSGKIYGEMFNYVGRWALLGPLMVKYKVEVSYEFNACGFSKASMSKFDTVFKSESEIPRAIIMCILKSENII